MSNIFAQTVSGLGTVASYTCPEAALGMNVKGKITMPTATINITPSQVVAVVNKNGSPVYTGAAGSEGFETLVNVDANDILTVVLTSSAPQDQGLSTIKTTISIG